MDRRGSLVVCLCSLACPCLLSRVDEASLHAISCFALLAVMAMTKMVVLTLPLNPLRSPSAHFPPWSSSSRHGPCPHSLAAKWTMPTAASGRTGRTARTDYDEAYAYTVIAWRAHPPHTGYTHACTPWPHAVSAAVLYCTTALHTRCPTLACVASTGRWAAGRCSAGLAGRVHTLLSVALLLALSSCYPLLCATLPRRASHGVYNCYGMAGTKEKVIGKCMTTVAY